MRRTILLLTPVFLYVAWMAMMAVHEMGHVLHARLSNGIVDHVSIPLMGFSCTYYVQNPHPAFVAWGGPVWGSVLPLIVSLTFTILRLPFRRALRLFAGFCLIANGAYLGVGWAAGNGVGDAGELIHYGTPRAALIAFGLAALSTGLYLWHLEGKPKSAGKM